MKVIRQSDKEGARREVRTVYHIRVVHLSLALCLIVFRLNSEYDTKTTLYNLLYNV